MPGWPAGEADAPVAGDQHIGWHVARDHAAGGDHAAVADGDAGQHDGAAADPHIVADADGSRQFQPRPAGLRVQRMQRGVELRRRRHLQVVADLDGRAIQEHAVIIDEGALPEADVRPIVAGESGKTTAPSPPEPSSSPSSATRPASSAGSVRL